jgi:hypothetical protein
LDKCVVVLGAGAGASNNLIRSLKAADPSLFVVGAHVDRFVLKKSSADRNCLLPASKGPLLSRALGQLVDVGHTLLIPNSDADVKAVSDIRAGLPCRTFLPTADAIELCQDKYRLTQHLRARRIPAPITVAVDDLDNVERLFMSVSSRTPIWCRIRSGGGSMGAAPMKTPDHVRGWITYWRDMRGVPVTSFTLSEYLPGRDYACQGLWKDGTLVLLKVCERLSYFGGRNQPSGMSSTPALGKLVFEPHVAEICAKAVSAVDPHASGVFSIDLKEDMAGVPCVTEINAGRFCMITNVFDLAGKNNMAGIYVRLAFDDPVSTMDVYEVPEEVYLVRDLDTLPGVFRADEFFTGIDEVVSQ